MAESAETTATGYARVHQIPHGLSTMLRRVPRERRPEPHKLLSSNEALDLRYDPCYYSYT